MSLYDFGDLVRFGANTAAEEESDPSRIDVSLPVFEAIVKGYVAGAGNILTDAEWDRTWHFVSAWQPATTDSIIPVVRSKRTKSAFIRTAPQPSRSRNEPDSGQRRSPGTSQAPWDGGGVLEVTAADGPAVRQGGAGPRPRNPKPRPTPGGRRCRMEGWRRVVRHGCRCRARSRARTEDAARKPTARSVMGLRTGSVGKRRIDLMGDRAVCAGDRGVGPKGPTIRGIGPLWPGKVSEA